MEKKQTAVQSLKANVLKELEEVRLSDMQEDKVLVRFFDVCILPVFEQALELEKGQIVEAMKVAMMPRLGDVTPEDYYTQTYGK
jgi:hypothetical protein